MSTIELIQGTDQWRQARCGSLGASRIADAVARTKSGYSASRANLMAELLVERMTGIPTEGFVNDAMRWGTEKEPEARSAYEFYFDAEVAQVGLVRHPTIAGTHASPDGLVGSDGLLELKAPQTATHLEFLLGGQIPDKYVKQCQWQMTCTGRKWCDFCSFDPRLPERMQLFTARLERDDVMIAALEKDVAAFLSELSAKVDALKAKFRAPASGAEPVNILFAG